MLESLIPGTSRVSLWVVLCLGLLGGPGVASAWAQAPKADKADAADEPADDDEANGVVDTKKAGAAGLEERFQDPNAAQALENEFTELYPRANTTAPALDRMEKAVNAMANGGNVDRVQIANYLQAQASIMTKHANIAAILNPDLPSKLVKDMEEAGYRLRHPLELAAGKNDNFRSIYTESLLSMAPDLLKNHLFARIWTMEALKLAREQSTIPILVDQLDDANQALSVKLLAAEALRDLTAGGTRDLGLQSATKAAQSLANFLDREKNAFWPVQFRALEALGALRVSTMSPTQPKAEFGETALRFLADPKAAPATRAWAGWSLGMMRPVNPQFNFTLVAFYDGLAAADIADEILQVREKNPQRASRLTELLVPLYQSFNGIGPSARNSGLLNAANPHLNAQKSQVSAIEALVRDVLARAIELSQAAGSQVKEREAALASAVSALRKGLKAPAELALIPGGDAFPPPANDAEPSAPTTSNRPAPEALATPARGTNTTSVNRRGR